GRGAPAGLRGLAGGREAGAQRRDPPKRWLISDESLVEIARRTPGSAAELSGIRGVNDKVASRSGAAVIAAIRAGQAVPEDELPRLPRKDRIPSGAQAVADLLSAVLRIRAREHNVATTLLASRDELERFAAGDRDGHPLSTGWRRTLVGAELAAIADGATAVRVKDGRLAVIPVDPPSEASGSDDA
ncbi:MAG TPA: ribonuclease D, partial [Coriobacteriia bacterium]|nr:ribonuclease D [Coriobacteriia bacterium]